MPLRLRIFVVLLIVGAPADVANPICYFLYLRKHDHDASWSLAWEYMTAFPGLPLTIVGLAPLVWLLVLGILSQDWKKRT